MKQTQVWNNIVPRNVKLPGKLIGNRPSFECAVTIESDSITIVTVHRFDSNNSPAACFAETNESPRAIKVHFVSPYLIPIFLPAKTVVAVPVVSKANLSISLSIGICIHPYIVSFSLITFIPT